MNLSQLMQGLFKGEQISVNTSQGSTTETGAALMARIRALTPGQIISGEVIESGEDFIRLLVGGNTKESFQLSAKLTQNITFPKGKHVLFEVKNNGKVLSLSPLYENVDSGANVSKAIEAAGLAVKEETVRLVQHLMEQGMPIDRESVAAAYQDMTAFKDVPLQDILDLYKLGLPVTKENLEQLATYKEQTHQLTSAMQTIAEQLESQMVSMMENGNTDKAMQLMKDVLEALGLWKEENGTKDAVPARELVPQADDNTKTFVPAEGAAMTEKEGIVSQERFGKESVPGGKQGEVNALTERLWSALQAKDTEAFAGILKESAGKELLTDLLTRELFLAPDEVEDKGQVREKIKKLYEFVSETEGKLKALQLTDTKVFDTISNTKQNVQFLNQLNEMYAYIQIPLKLGESEANGDLYVYSNKRNLSSADGEITAFLHLDMKNLGPVDVFVSLKNNAVKTKFSVAEEEMIDFLYEHMDILNARLQKRGYEVSANVVQMQGTDTEEKAGNVMEMILEEKANIPAFAHYSFDARA